jgi:hypothetical protein
MRKFRLMVGGWIEAVSFLEKFVPNLFINVP